MAIDKAKAFLLELSKDEELRNKFSGFTLDELKQAAKELKESGELSDEDLDNAAGGMISGIDINF
jgi:predicted nucleic acid-binding protein